MKKVMDHDHLTGEFRGPAYSICNLNFRNPDFIPVFFYNFAGYDAHLFIKKFGNDDGRFDLISNTEEKYISFTKYVNYNTETGDRKSIKLRFLDSFKFLQSSLEKFAGKLRTENFRELPTIFPEDFLGLVTRKYAYLYE